MSHTVELNDSLANTVLAKCTDTSKTLDEHVTHLIKLGLQVHVANDNVYENDSDLDDLADAMWSTSDASKQFFQARIEKGLGVGLDDNGNLVYQRDINR